MLMLGWPTLAGEACPHMYLYTCFQVLQLVRLAHPPDAVRLANYMCVYIYIYGAWLHNAPCVLCLHHSACLCLNS